MRRTHTHWGAYKTLVFACVADLHWTLGSVLAPHSLHLHDYALCSIMRRFFVTVFYYYWVDPDGQQKTD
jgi:hypothetical protein